MGEGHGQWRAKTEGRPADLAQNATAHGLSASPKHQTGLVRYSTKRRTAEKDAAVAILQLCSVSPDPYVRKLIARTPPTLADHTPHSELHLHRRPLGLRP